MNEKKINNSLINFSDNNFINNLIFMDIDFLNKFIQEITN